MNDTEITANLTVSATEKIVVGRDIWSKIKGKTSVKKLVNKCGSKQGSTGSLLVLIQS